MPRGKGKYKSDVFAELAGVLAARLRPPFGVVLGSPAEVTALAAALPQGDATCYQMDLHQASRLKAELGERGLPAKVETKPDLWDLPADFQTLLYPVPYGGERALKLDLLEQAFHVLRPGGTLVVLSPYETDQFFPQALKKVFGKVHVPMEGNNAVFWCQRTGDRPRRRHEVTFQVRVDEETSYRFVSRPGTFSYGRFDDGARALTETMEVNEGDRIADVGCGVGTNGILAARAAGPGTFVGFVDSNVRAVALAELNARELGVPAFQAYASSTVNGPPVGSFDVVLANPPYYAQHGIARLFIERGHDLLKPGGRFYLVTKVVDPVVDMVRDTFGEPAVAERRGYLIVSAARA